MSKAQSNGMGPAWDLDRIVAELRTSRGKAQQDRTRDGTIIQMPSREALREIVAGLFAALFPTHFGLSDFTDQGIDYFVGHKLDSTLRALQQQVMRELLFGSTMEPKELNLRASEITREFGSGLPRVRALLETDIQAAYQGDPAARSIEEVRFCYPGITAVTHHRIAHQLYLLELPLLARIVSELAHAATGIDIHPGAEIGDSFFIDHGTGVVIGETARIGRRVRLYQAVTLGAKRFPVGEDRALVKGNLRHPIVEDDVVIYAGATILGRVTIGRNSTIGGNVWLTRDVPPGSNVSQALARTEAFDEGGGI
ncbi:MAG: serine acetyltransferase [Deltaproteobacteria bacterium]|jgi:serine O-acetyltransferase|nr:serine acetyltransferase [Deltaproteobacteria bacterium]